MITFSVTAKTESLGVLLEELEASFAFYTVSNLNPYSWNISHFVEIMINISSDVLSLSYEDICVMIMCASSFILSIKDSENKKMPLVFDSKLDFYEDKYVSIFHICNQILSDSEQKNVYLDGKNIRKTFSKITKADLIKNCIL